MTYQITYEELVKLLHYDPDTGIFTNKKSRGGLKVGVAAGNLRKDGYIQISLHGKNYKAHRLAWLWCMQEWPSAVIDHINGNPSDNRLDNLREATLTQNQYNTGKTVSNTTGYKGVSYYKRHGKYVAQITINGSRKHLGYFETPELASQAYETAATEYFKEFKCENTI